MLIVCTVTSHEANLRERILKSDLLSDLAIMNVGLQIPLRLLRDLADDETTGDIGHPVCKLHSVRPGVELICIAKVVRLADGSIDATIRSWLIMAWSVAAVALDWNHDTFATHVAGTKTIKGLIDSGKTALCNVDLWQLQTWWYTVLANVSVLQVLLSIATIGILTASNQKILQPSRQLLSNIGRFVEKLNRDRMLYNTTRSLLR